MSARIDIITYNIRHGLHQPAVDDDLSKLFNLGGNHYIAYQEIHGQLRSRRLEETAERFGYGCVRFEDVPDYKTPIAYNRKYKSLVAEGSEFLCGPMGAKGAGPATAHDKRTTWGLFEDKTSGNKEVVINCHLPPSPYVFQRGLLHAEAVGNLVEVAKRLRNKYEADVLVCGDMNTNYWDIKGLGKGKARFDPLIKEGFTAHFSHFPKDIPTFPKSRAHIDWVIGNIVPKHAAVMLGYNSDHRPVRVRY